MAHLAEQQSYSMGPFKVTLLPDGGGIVVPTVTYPASTPDAWQGRFASLLDDEGALPVTIAGFLIEVGDQKIIMDTGLGPLRLDFPGFGPFFGGKFLDSLAATGVRREDVTEVVFSHMHLDHVGWSTIEENGQRVLTFPNARYLVTELEWNFWYGTDHPAGPNPERVQQPLAGVIQFIAPGDTLAPGITVLHTPGHTPGHISFELKAGDERLMLIVDLLHNIVQFAEPDWGVPFDFDMAQAAATRKAMLAELVKPDTVTGDAHFSDRVFGRLTREDGQWIWHPF